MFFRVRIVAESVAIHGEQPYTVRIIPMFTIQQSLKPHSWPCSTQDLPDGPILSLRPTTMNLAVFDSDVAAQALWQQCASSADLQFLAGNSLETLKSILEQDTCIIVIDQSVASTDLVSLATSCCLQYRQHIVICTSERLTIPHAVQMMAQGVHWAFDKPLKRPLIDQALPGIVKTASLVSQQLLEFRHLTALFETLSSREHEVLDLILEGVSNKDAAVKLEISVRTVEARRAKVYDKCNANNVVDLIRKVERLELLRAQFSPKRAESHDSILHHHLRSRSTMGRIG